MICQLIHTTMILSVLSSACAVSSERHTDTAPQCVTAEDTCHDAHYDPHAPACACGTQYQNKSGWRQVPDNCRIMECDGASPAGGRLEDLRPGETCILALCCDY
jgi:hypothetical protein